MSDEPDLVSLLYRADWMWLSLTAEVGIIRDLDLWGALRSAGMLRL